MIKWDEITYFRENEFVHPELLRPTMIYMLDDLRSQFGEPLIVSNSFRTWEEHEGIYRKRGIMRPPDSGHLADPNDGLYSGVDLTTKRNFISPQERYRLATIALNVGFTRIGIRYDDHVHLDIEERLPPHVMW